MGSKWTSGHSCVQSQACQLLSTRTPGDSGRGFTNTMAPELCFCANFQLVFGKHSNKLKKKKVKTGLWDHQGTHDIHSDLVWLGLLSLPGYVWT